MKRIACMILAIMLLVGMMAFGVSAAEPEAYLKGPDEVRAGDTITLTFGITGGNAVAVDGRFSYDSSVLTLKKIEKKIKSDDWMVESNGAKFMAYDNALKTPITGKTDVITATFAVSETIAAGTLFTISCGEIIVSDGDNDMEPSAVRYTNVIASPLSDNNDLASLTVSNAELDKEFSAFQTKYSASVPFDVEELEVSATAADSKAKVTIGSTKLTAGTTTKVTVKVKAENGDTKTYTISVTRGADPNAPADDPTQPTTSDETEPSESNDQTQPTTPEATQPETNDPADGEARNVKCICSWLWIVTAALAAALIVMTVLYLQLRKKLNG